MFYVTLDMLNWANRSSGHEWWVMRSVPYIGDEKRSIHWWWEAFHTLVMRSVPYIGQWPFHKPVIWIFPMYGCYDQNNQHIMQENDGIFRLPHLVATGPIFINIAWWNLQKGGNNCQLPLYVGITIDQIPIKYIPITI